MTVAAYINVWSGQIHCVVFTCKPAIHGLRLYSNYNSINHMRTVPMQLMIFQKKVDSATSYIFKTRSQLHIRWLLGKIMGEEFILS